MAHLQEGEITRLAEGNVDEVERERFLKHLAECEHCLKVYSYTLEFIQEERRGKFLLKFPVLKKIFQYPYTQSMETLFKKKVYIPAFAALLLILVTLPFVIKMFMNNEITAAKLDYIEEIIMEMHKPKHYDFLPSNDKFYAAVRAGFFTEELSVVLPSKNKKELGTTISRILMNQLKIIAGNKPGSPFPGPGEIRKDNFKTMVNRISSGMEAAALAELYQFGRFVERSLLATFENKLPEKKEIEKYRDRLKHCDLPKGVFDKLEDLKTAADMKKIRKLWEGIKEIFLI